MTQDQVDGFWTGEDYTVGSGKIQFGINENSATTTIDTNEIKTSLSKGTY